MHALLNDDVCMLEGKRYDLQYGLFIVGRVVKDL